MILSVKRAALGAALAVASVSLAACEDNAANYLEPTADRAYNFLLLREATNLPRGTVASSRTFATATTVTSTVNLRGLEQLGEGKFYQLWVATESGPPPSTIVAVQPLPIARLRAVRTDTTISPAGDFVPDSTVLVDVTDPAAHQIFFGGPGVIVNATSSAIPVPAGALRLSVLVTVDSNVASPTPPDANGTQAKLWARNIVPAVPAAPVPPATTSATASSVALAFGNLDLSSPTQYVYGPSGRGQGALFNDDIMEVYDTLLARPPVGYYYEVHLAGRDTNQNFNWRDTISLGPLTAPDFSTSLFTADVEQVGGVVQLSPVPLIYAAATRIDGDTVAGLQTSGNRFRDRSNFFVSLESKYGSPAMSPNIILNGVLPQPIRFRE